MLNELAMLKVIDTWCAPFTKPAPVFKVNFLLGKYNKDVPKGGATLNMPFLLNKVVVNKKKHSKGFLILPHKQQIFYLADDGLTYDEICEFMEILSKYLGNIPRARKAAIASYVVGQLFSKYPVKSSDFSSIVDELGLLIPVRVKK